MKVAISKDLAESLLDHLLELIEEYPSTTQTCKELEKQYSELEAALGETCETCKLKTDVHHIDCHGCSHFWPSMWEGK
jgi:predicted amidophosphoribosyltransferase